MNTITSSDYKQWLNKNANGYSVLMIKLKHCGPCSKAYPLYRDIQRKLDGNKKFQFATYTIDIENDYEFVKNILQVSDCPAFHVYLATEKIYAVTSPQKVVELEDFIHNLP